MATKATLRRNGMRMVTVRVAAHLDAAQLAVLLWGGIDYVNSDARNQRLRVPAAQVRTAIASRLIDHGESSSYYVENDDEWEFKGGRDWALDQVMRVYGFTEADLEREDRERRAQPKVGERIVNTCRGQHGYGAHGTVAAARPDNELYVEYDDGTTRVVPAAWLAREDTKAVAL